MNVACTCKSHSGEDSSSASTSILRFLPDQVKDEFLRVMDIIFIIFRALDFQNFEAQISLRDKENRTKYIGSDENWERAERAIVEACEEKGLKAKVEYGHDGDRGGVCGILADDH